MGELSARVLTADEVSPPLRAALFGLYHAYYEATDPERFAIDLGGKDHVILLTDRAGEPRGFSTLAVLSIEHAGERHRAIFSGDTIIDHRFWGEQALAFTWLRLAGRIKAQVPEVPLHWFLIVKGHRTYRYLPAFSIAYHPTWAHRTPPRVQALMDHLARDRFGDCYDPATGVVAFPVSRGQLRPEWAVVPAEDAARPDVRFFLERNPGYVHGHELVCLAELSLDTLRPLARRLFREGFRCATPGVAS